MEALARDLGRLEGRLEALEEKVGGVERGLDERLTAIERKLDRLTEAFNMGRGAALTIAKIGALLMVLCGAAAWFIDGMAVWAR